MRAKEQTKQASKTMIKCSRSSRPWEYGRGSIALSPPKAPTLREAMAMVKHQNDASAMAGVDYPRVSIMLPSCLFMILDDTLPLSFMMLLLLPGDAEVPLRANAATHRGWPRLKRLSELGSAQRHHNGFRPRIRAARRELHIVCVCIFPP